MSEIKLAEKVKGDRYYQSIIYEELLTISGAIKVEVEQIKGQEQNLI